MRFPRRLPFAFIVIVSCVLAGCTPSPPDRLQGYIEGEFVYVASPLAGALDKLLVKRGDNVKARDLLFVLESGKEVAARAEAERRLNQSRATLEDAKKGLRPSELKTIEAQFMQARAALQLAEKEFTRQEQLFRDGGVSTPQELDRARSSRDQTRDRVAQLESQLETAKLGARPDQIAAAEANVRALEAALAKAEWDLAQKRQSAPTNAVVFDTLYREGEWVAAGRPVVSLLPPQNIKLRVFVPEPQLASLHVGDAAQVFVDGASNSITATVSFIAPRAEFTPPVIYSRESRRKFVYLVEATFDTNVAAQLHPGQPVDVKFSR